MSTDTNEDAALIARLQAVQYRPILDINRARETVREAADRIEALSADLDRAGELLIDNAETAAKTIKALSARVAELEATVDATTKHYGGLVDKAEATLAKVRDYLLTVDIETDEAIQGAVCLDVLAILDGDVS